MIYNGRLFGIGDSVIITVPSSVLLASNSEPCYMEKGTYVGTIDSEREFGNANMTKIAIKVGNNTSMGFVFVHGAYLEIADTRMVLTEKYKPLKERDVIRTNERYTPPRTRRDGIR